MRLFLLLLLSITSMFADMGKLVNLELFDNRNPAVITDIEDAHNHVVVNLSFLHKEKESGAERINIQQEQHYNAELKTYRRFDEVVLYFNAFQTIKGVQHDPTANATPDVDKEYSAAQLGLATTLLDDFDLGVSYGYELTDSNTTQKSAQIGLRYLANLSLGAVVGTQWLRDENSVEDQRLFYRAGLSIGELSYLLLDMSFTYREPSTTPAENGLLATSQPKVYEAVVQLQGNEEFHRGGLRFEYQKTYPLTALQEPSYSRKLRYHSGVKVEREENSFSIFFMSYERREQAQIIDHQFEIGVTLRGFYD